MLVSSWTPITSLLQDVDGSIWSTPELFSTEKNQCLSESSVPWPPVSISDTEASPAEVWVPTRDSVLFNIRGITPDSDSWNRDHTPKASVSDSSCTELGTTNSSCPTSEIKLNPPAVTATVLGTNGSEVVAVTSSEQTADYPAGDSVNTAFSTEQLCEHLINSNDGWGKRPVDQTTPWDLGDLAKVGADQVGRSGITTPTPGSRSTAGGTAGLRFPLQASPMESNVWTSEPPTGTGIWEMHYENFGTRSSIWQHSTETHSATNLSNSDKANPIESELGGRGATHQTPSSLFDRQVPFRNWSNAEKQWTGSLNPSTTGRPLLGGARANQTDEIGWCNNPAFGPVSLPSFENNTNAWDTVACAADALHWNANGSNLQSSVPSLFSPADDSRRQQPNLASHSAGERMLVHPYSNTYRADLVKYLMSQGFKKEDAQAALIDCNMEPERALQELRERYNPTRSFNFLSQSSSNGLFQNTAGNGISQFSNNFSGTPHQQTTPSNISPTASISGISNLSATPNRKLTGSSLAPSNSQLIPLSGHPNPQLIRQQLTQQVRSALNLSLPNQLTGPLASCTTGNSLLGQPPPPLLNGAGVLPPSVPSGHASLGGIPGNNFSSHNRSNNHPTFGPSQAVQNPTKRSARQIAIINGIQELQKKLQSIQQQVLMYRSNPTMCAQPQYADVFAELQGQMQQIEAQLRAKHAQLNIAYAQDVAASSTRAHQSALDGNLPIGLNNPSLSQNRLNQDQLIQQLMELRLRSGNSENTDTEFPSIGTWTPQNKVSSDSLDKSGAQDNHGPRFLTGARVPGSKVQSVGGWGNGWSSNNNPSIPNTQRANPSSILNWPQNANSVRQLSGFDCSTTNLNSPKPNGANALDSQQSGQWLLVQPPVGCVGPNLNGLYNLLVTNYGLVNFHVLNPSTCCAMVRLQSIEYAVQLMRSFGDRLAIELITEPEAAAQLNQRNLNSRAEIGASNQSNFSTDILSSPVSASACSWMTGDQLLSNNSSGSFGTKKSVPPSTARPGVMVSGIH
ncbi:unnamed protein product [Calicophoron daubneyi]|uniref:UBA domain-containing protein n=1 Tax=Calicophoron daubneyi TaxID=300641 RepID=A0AAV2U0Y4_CALDB